MSKNDIGALLAAVVATVSAFAVVARDFMGRGLVYIGDSFAALLKSKAAWAAALVCTIGGFWVGHIEGGLGKRNLRSQVVALETRAKASAAAATSAIAKAAILAGEVKTLKGTIEARDAEIARLTASPRAVSAPATGKARKAVTKSAPKKPAASEPAKPAWTPWS